MLTLSAVAQRLGIPQNAVVHAANIGKLRTTQHLVGSRRYVSEADFQAFKTTWYDPAQKKDRA